MNAATRPFRRSRKAAKAAPKAYAPVLQRAIQAHQAGDLDAAERRGERRAGIALHDIVLDLRPVGLQENRRRKPGVVAGTQ